jgi:L-asparaginase/Glu-tRNA(Gln) amidotransferase subunit D
MRVTTPTTSGTIEKTFSEHDGSLRHAASPLPRLLATLRLPDLEIETRQIPFKDSAEMTDDDRAHILRGISAADASADASVLLRGADTLERTGRLLHGSSRRIRFPSSSPVPSARTSSATPTQSGTSRKPFSPPVWSGPASTP